MGKSKLIDRGARMGTARILTGGASRFWLIVTAVSWTFRLVRWLASRGEHTYRQELKPGDKLVIEHSRDSLGDRPTHEPT